MTTELKKALEALIEEAQRVADDHHRSRYIRLDQALASARAALSLSTEPREGEAVPEGCTPADARMLRTANHALAMESHELQEVLADLYQQVKLFCETEGEADFETGRALYLLSRLRPLEFNWPFTTPPSDVAHFEAQPDGSVFPVDPTDRGIGTITPQPPAEPIKTAEGAGAVALVADLSLLVTRMPRRLSITEPGAVHVAGNQALARQATDYLKRKGLASPLREEKPTPPLKPAAPEGSVQPTDVLIRATDGSGNTWSRAEVEELAIGLEAIASSAVMDGTRMPKWRAAADRAWCRNQATFAVLALRALSNHPQPVPAGDVGKRLDVKVLDGLSEASIVRMVHDFPALAAFHSKHALGPLAAPSCLMCGKSTQGADIGIKHTELPSVVICQPCVTAVSKHPQADEGRS